MNIELPVLTQMLFNLGDYCQENWKLIVGVTFAVVAVLLWLLKSPVTQVSRPEAVSMTVWWAAPASIQHSAEVARSGAGSHTARATDSLGSGYSVESSVG